MDQFSEIKLHKGQRLARRMREERIWTPPKIFKRDNLERTCSRMQCKMCYDSTIFCRNKTIMWMQTDFQEKLRKYQGSRKGEMAKKMSRMDKVRLKETLNFKLEKHPILRIFQRANNKLEKGLLWDGFQCIKL